MDYRQLLIERHCHAQAEPLDGQILDYMGLRNLEAMQAWRRKLNCNALGIDASAAQATTARTWLPASRGVRRKSA